MTVSTGSDVPLPGIATGADRCIGLYALDQPTGEIQTFRSDRVVLCTGYMAEMVEDTFGAAHGPLALSYSREPEPLGTGGALRLALPELGSDPVLAVNGDSYCHADLAAMWRERSRRGAEAAMLLTEVPDVSRYGCVAVGPDEAVTSFVEKGGAEGPGLINAGVYVLPRARIEAIPADRPVSLEKEVLPLLVGKGLYGHRAAGPFLDIGTPASYAAAERFFAGASGE